MPCFLSALTAKTGDLSVLVDLLELQHRELLSAGASVPSSPRSMAAKDEETVP